MSDPDPRKPLLRRILTADDNLNRLILVSLAIFAAMVALNPDSFLTLRNFVSMSYSFPELGLLALGLALCMITGGIDLSVVGIANLTSVLAALLMVSLLGPDSPPAMVLPVLLLAIAVALVTGVLAGWCNGMIVSRFRIHPVLVTLGTWQVFSGIAIILTKGYAVPGFPDAFLALGNGRFLGLPIPLYLFLAAAAVVALVLNRTRFGLSLFLIGTNETAARFAGIPVRSVLVRTYMSSGFLAALAGIIMIARTNQAKADYGESYILQAVLVNLLAGVRWSGGYGRVTGVLLAVVTLQMLSSGFNMMRFNNFARDFTWGVFLILIMVANHLFTERKRRRESAAGASNPEPTPNQETPSS
jgi:simple sugar transport system permease protein